MPTTIDPGAIESLLIIRLSSIGDVAFALPALETLRASLPQARIGWVVEDRAADLLQGHPAIDELIVMPRRRWRKMRADGAGRLAVLGELRRFGRALAKREYQVAIDLQGNLKSGLVTRSSRAGVRIGYASADTREPNWLFTNRQVALGNRPLHRVERDLSLITALGIPYEFRWPRVAWTAADQAAADALAAPAAAGGRRLIVLNPGTSDWFKSKRWPAAHWVGLIRELAKDESLHLLLNWGPGEEELVGEIAEAAGPLVNVPAFLPTMRAVARLMSRADLVIGSDTGPVHISALLGRPTVILFGPYDPRLYYPWQHPERALYRSLPCSPCRYRDCPTVACMREISVAAVLDQARAVLAGIATEPGFLRPRKSVRV